MSTTSASVDLRSIKLTARDGVSIQDVEASSRARHELKYLVSYHEYLVLRNRLKFVLQQDSHSMDDHGYNVRSLYFDDMDDSAMFSKQAGLLNRKKIRIRIYNCSDQIIKLEKKSRFNNMIKKEAIQISRLEYDAMITNNIEFLRDAGTETALMFYYEFKQALLRPKVVVDYTREAYMLPYMGIRITFDKMLRAGTRTDIFDTDQILVKAMEEHLMIMEVKYDLFLPDYLASLLQEVSRGKLSLSKYVMCRELNPAWF